MAKFWAGPDLRAGDVSCQLQLFHKLRAALPKWPLYCVAEALSGRGDTVAGICEGFQMLGDWLLEPGGVESSTARLPGLGLLPLFVHPAPSLDDELDRLAEAVRSNVDLARVAKN